MLLQPVEVPGPQPAIPGEPGVELDKRLRSDVVEPTLRFGARVDDARVPEHAQKLYSYSEMDIFVETPEIVTARLTRSGVH
jgi:hypothetical protein